jgi:tyrosyl-tRNA synthetase
MTLPILEGLDGAQKMSKSLGNYIGIDEPPQTVFGKAMSIPDTLIVRYLELATAVPRDEIAAIAVGLQAGTVNPRDAKVRLAKTLVAQYHSAQAADEAARWFADTFGARTFPADAPQFAPPADALDSDGCVWIVRLLTLSGAAASGSEARRLIRQGGVQVDGETVRDEDAKLSLGQERRLQVGKRRFFRIFRP